MAASFVIAGLGNPGPEYENTRHNAGFLALDHIYARLGATERWREKFGAHCAEGTLDGITLLLIKPQSYMNLSGEPTQRILSFYQVPPANLVVLHDELDLPLGTLRLRVNGGEGGHNGIRSLVKCLGTKDFVRIRLGIGRPPAPPESAQKRSEVTSWVLGRISREEREALEGLWERAFQALSVLLKSGLSQAQQQFNG